MQSKLYLVYYSQTVKNQRQGENFENSKRKKIPYTKTWGGGPLSKQ